MSPQLLKEIRKVNLTVNSTHIFFDRNGDPSLGYDILQWTMSKSNQSTHIKTIAEYWPDGNITNLGEDLVKEKTNVTVRSNFHNTGLEKLLNMMSH